LSTGQQAQQVTKNIRYPLSGEQRYSLTEQPTAAAGCSEGWPGQADAKQQTPRGKSHTMSNVAVHAI
jgi:hypothetical protein